MNRLCSLLLAATCCMGGSFPLIAQEFERVLVPLAVKDQPGAYGSQWSTEFAVVFLDEPGRVFGFNYPCCDLPPIPPPGVTFRPPLYLTEPGDPPGALLHVQADKVERRLFSLRVRDVSRAADSAGIELPVVRERDGLVREGYILNVPVSDGFRMMLRLYSFRPELPAGFTVTATNAVTHELLGAADVQLSTSPKALVVANHVLPLRPGGIALALETLLPGITMADAITVRVTPHPGTSRYWGFVSITNNRTQEVTIVTIK